MYIHAYVQTYAQEYKNIVCNMRILNHFNYYLE